jgi:hypothetical protein
MLAVRKVWTGSARLPVDCSEAASDTDLELAGAVLLVLLLALDLVLLLVHGLAAVVHQLDGLQGLHDGEHETLAAGLAVVVDDLKDRT